MNFFIVMLRAAMAVLMIIISTVGKAEARPGLYPVQELIYPYPSASQQTTVVRDLLGNQGTAYAYQNHNGFSASAVAVSRSDNSKTLAYLPVAPVLAAHQPLIHDPYHSHHAHHHHDHYQAAFSPALAYSGYHQHAYV